MMVKIFDINWLYISIFFLVATNSFSQKVMWDKSYGGLQSEYLFDVLPTPDYGFLLAGSSLSGKSGNKQDEGIRDLDYWLWKMDEHGDLDWQKSFGGNGTDLLQSVDLTPDGGFILGGTSTSGQGEMKSEPARGQEDLWIIKLNAKGDLQWEKTLGGSGRDELKQIVSVTGGGYLIGASSNSHPLSEGSFQTGEKRSALHGNLDYWVIRLDGSGEILWEKTFGGRYRDELAQVVQTRDGGFLIGGTSNSPVSGTKTERGHGQGDFWIIKLDRDGEEEWQKALGGENDDKLSVLLEKRDGGYVLGGSSASGVSGNKDKGNGKGSDFWIVELDDRGNSVWQGTYDFGQNDVLTSIVEDEEGNLLVGGYAQSERTRARKNDGKGVNDYIAMKIDTLREKAWEKTVGSSGTDIMRKVVETHDGGYLLSGISSGKVSRDRNTGQGRFDFWVVKIKDREKEEKEHIRALTAWPNPTRGFTNVIIDHDFLRAEVSVYDLLGREVQRFGAKNRTVPVDLGHQAEGVYIIRVKTDVKTQSIKIIRGH